MSSATTLHLPAGEASSAGDSHPIARTDAHGFIVNDPATALRLAREHGQPLLIDFFGIWCPPCNQLDEQVFSKREFQERTARFVRLKLDADNPVSWELKSRFHIGPYPTIVFASVEGEEISRVVGFLPLRDLVREADRAWQNRAAAFPTLVANADAGDAAAAERLGLIYLDRHDWAKAMHYLENVAARREEHAAATIGALEEQLATTAPAPEPRTALEDQLIAAYELSFAVAGGTADSAERRLKLAELLARRGLAERRAKVLEAAAEVAQALTRAPDTLAGTAWSVADCWSLLGSVREALGQSGPAAEAYRTAAAEYAKASTGRRDRGIALERAWCLGKAGELAQAEAIYKSLESLYPREFTFFFDHGEMLFEAKRFAAAEPLARKALQYSYGDNHLRAVHLLASIQIAQGHADEGRALVQKTLDAVELPADAQVRTHRYVKALRKLLEP